MIENLEKYPVLKQAYDSFEAVFKDNILHTAFEKDDLCITIDKTYLVKAVSFLKDKSGFNALNDIIGLDNLNTKKEGEKRFSILYLLYSFPGAVRFRLKVDVDENESIDTLSNIYRAANWAEREIYDMLGIKFSGHPDMTRIYMPDEYTEFPLRKDFPLEGKRDGV